MNPALGLFTRLRQIGWLESRPRFIHKTSQGKVLTRTFTAGLISERANTDLWARLLAVGYQQSRGRDLTTL